MKVVEGKKVYSVSEVNYFAKMTLEEMSFWVEGEITSARQNSSYNFFYLTLKDENAILPAIADAQVLNKLPEPFVGQKVLAFGYLSLYEPRAQYQLRISQLEVYGEGILQKQLDQLISKLRAEGLFDSQYKKPIPLYPKKICVVTSYGSDAWNDFKTHTTDKFPIIEFFTADVRVQGSEAIPQLLRLLPKVDKKGFDVIIITRGGGSIEDLAAFNDETVARCIFKMKTPIIVAIGHEANESLAEWVADKRASTPTDAANIITSAYGKIFEVLEKYQLKLNSKSDAYFTQNLQRLDYLYIKLEQVKLSFKDLPARLSTIKESLRRHESYLITDAQAKVNQLFESLKRKIKVIIDSYQKGLIALNKSLTILSPENTLGRGYSITFDTQGKIIRNIDSVVVGQMVGVKLTDGLIKSKVTFKSKNEQKFARP